MITVVLDDDPTGTQAMNDVSVILDWSEPDVWKAIRPGDRAVHVLTNARAYDADDAAAITGGAASAAMAHLPGCHFVLRGDSTLRGHVWEEYEALRAVVAPAAPSVPLLLVPALPAAGRVTRGGVHMALRDGEEIPLHETEYAHDGAFSYTTSDLAGWAQERSGGRLAAKDAVRIDLERLRAPGGAAAVAEAIHAVHQCGRSAVVVPDAETDRDLATIAAGVERAQDAGAPFIVRCAPAFVAALTGAHGSPHAPYPSGDSGVLILCGSFVPRTTAQLARLEEARPGSIVPVSAAALASADWEDEVVRVADEANGRLRGTGLAVVATDRERDPELVPVAAQRRVAFALAQVARRVPVGVVIAKGGITSAVTAQHGLLARVARVLGPVCPGVARWSLADGIDLLIVPGNVGDDDLLVQLVAGTVR